MKNTGNMVFSSESGISLMVEHQFSKLRAGVRFSYPAQLSSALAASFIQTSATGFYTAIMADTRAFPHTQKAVRELEKRQGPKGSGKAGRIAQKGKAGTSNKKKGGKGAA
jgi:hypothetical protein